MKKDSFQCIWQHSINTTQPIYIIIDDAVNEKTVYVYQFITIMLRCGDVVLPYDIILYQKDEMSKIELAQMALKEFPKPIIKVMF